jgi:hypothetical protein
MVGTIDIVMNIPDDLKNPNVATRELQVLIDGKLLTTDTVSETGRCLVKKIPVIDSTTITLELRGIHSSGAMDAPFVHEFIIVDGLPNPQSDMFNITILKRGE